MTAPHEMWFRKADNDLTAARLLIEIEDESNSPDEARTALSEAERVAAFVRAKVGK